jgi:predicted nucleic acid-binding protein
MIRSTLRSTLADTGPLYALADPSDQFHARATAELGAIEKGGLTVAISYPTLSEAYTLVMRRLGLVYARQWLDELLDGSVLVNPEAADYKLAMVQLHRFPDQPITLVDAVTAVLAKRLQIRVWTFDRHFVAMRTRIWH